jgi:hypothetical protein
MAVTWRCATRARSAQEAVSRVLQLGPPGPDGQVEAGEKIPYERG